MMTQLIEVGESNTVAKPTIRMAATPVMGVWNFAGLCEDDTHQWEGAESRCDLNRATQSAATELAAKVTGRRIEIEVVIDPIIPSSCLTETQLIPLVAAIAENASAAVEPGPGRVQIRTWWRGNRIGVDAIGLGGELPDVIRSNIMRPGFSTRVADWDTGFGLHDANEHAAAFGGYIEIFKAEKDIGFRLVIPLKHGSPASPPEKSVGLESDDDPGNNLSALNGQHPMLSLHQLMEGYQNVDHRNSVEA